MTTQAVQAFCKTLTLAQAQEWKQANNRAYLLDQLMAGANIGANPYDMRRIEDQFANLLRLDIERQILEKLVDDALFYGCTVAVHDGEAWALHRSLERDTILAATRSTDADTLMFFDADGVRVGVVCLIYGNGYDLISDSTDSPAMQALLDGAEALAESLQG